MASTSSKHLQAPTLLLVAVLLLLVCATRVVQAARPEPRAKNHMPQAELAVSAATVVGGEKSCSGPGMEVQEAAEPEAMECEGQEGGEECLMRRTLVAHTDYIYTQGKHN